MGAPLPRQQSAAVNGSRPACRATNGSGRQTIFLFGPPGAGLALVFGGALWLRRLAVLRHPASGFSSYEFLNASMPQFSQDFDSLRG